MFGRGRKNGNGGEPPTSIPPAMLQLPSGLEDDGWGPEARTFRGPSGIWIVVKLNKGVKEGEWTNERVGSSLRGGHKSWLGPAGNGIEAIQFLYKREYEGCADGEESKADGRYIALDFYGGERVEALVTGDWKVDIAVAPPSLGPSYV